jgi:hypothetical protein
MFNAQALKGLIGRLTTGVDVRLAAGLFLLAMLAGFVLSLGYPFAFTNLETSGYILTTKYSFPNHYLYSVPFDWWRTIGYGFFQQASEWFPNASNAIFWLHNTIFSINIALAYFLGATLFQSRRLGLALALTLFAGEFLAMRTFFHNLQNSADPFFGGTVLAGIMLALIGWLRARKAPLFAGYALMGMAAFAKPAGIFLLPVWLPFAVVAAMKLTQKRSARITCALGLSLLLSGGVAFLSVRNLIMYGNARPMACGSYEHLAKALLLAQDNDQPLPSPDESKRFMAQLHELQQYYDETASQWFPEWRLFLWEAWHRDDLPLGPYNEIARMKLGTNLDRRDSLQMCKLEPYVREATLRIIQAHRFDYLKMVVGDYITIFQEGNPLPVDSETFFLTTKMQYAETLIWARDWPDYPAMKADVSACNAGVVQALKFMCLNPVVVFLIAVARSMQLVVVHLAFLFAGAVLLARAFKLIPKSEDGKLENICLVVVMLFLSVALHNALVAAVELPRLRYMIATEMMKHLLFVIALFAIGIYAGKARVNAVKEQAEKQSTKPRS